jgi:hypothetical protein
MPLSAAAAARKDAWTKTKLEHRHFATIARIIAKMSDRPLTRDEIAWHFAGELREHNRNFDSQRFVAACNAK